MWDARTQRRSFALFDKATGRFDTAFTALSGDALNAVLAQASTASFRIVAFMPAVLLVVFGLVWLNDRARAASSQKSSSERARLAAAST